MKLAMTFYPRGRRYSRLADAVIRTTASMLVMLAAFAFYHSAFAAGSGTQDNITPEQDQFQASFQEPGRARVLVTTRDHAVLSGEIAARIGEIKKRPGETFTKGERLISFDCSAYEAQHAAAAAEYRQADAQFKSQKRLFELGSLGELDLVMSQSVRDRARAELQLQEVFLKRCHIDAPYDGAVIEWLSQPYQIANPGDQLIEIAGSKHLELEVVVPSVWLRQLKIGETFDFRIEETGTSHVATITRIGANIDPVSQTVKVFASIGKTDVRLLSGMSGIASFSSASQ